MPVRRLPRKMFVLLLVAAAVVLGSRLGGPVAAGASSQSVGASANSRANAVAVPPMLAPVTPSELAVIRQGEAEEAAASAYDPPASAVYSLAVLNGYGGAGK